MRSSLFWDVTQCWLVVSFRKFGTLSVASSRGPSFCPEKPVSSYYSTMCNVQDERKSYKFCSLLICFLLSLWFPTVFEEPTFSIQRQNISIINSFALITATKRAPTDFYILYANSVQMIPLAYFMNTQHICSLHTISVYRILFRHLVIYSNFDFPREK